jgi:CRISPR-associated protein Cas8a1/Csx13
MRFAAAEASRDEQSLDKFEVALAELPPRVRVRTVSETVGTGRAKQRVEREEFFWIDSTIRPHIATNLAVGRFWYDRFDHLYRDAATRKRVGYETKGLQVMATNRTLTDEQEAAFIAAMHRAIFMGRGRIYAETMGQDAVRRKEPANSATQKRWEKFMERLRLGLVGAKTANQTQSVVNELLARNGTVKELRNLEAVQLVRRFIFGDDWQRAKNLALFALASYQHPPKVEPIPGDTESDDTQPEPTDTPKE